MRKKSGKDCDSCHNVGDEPSFLISKSTDGNIQKEEIVHAQQNMLYIELTVQNLGSK